MEGDNLMALEVLSQLPAHEDPKVISAAACRFSIAWQECEGILFKQARYAICTQ